MNIRKDNTHLRPHRAGLGIKPLGAWIAGLALAALVVSPPALYGAVIDDFNGDQPGWDGWNSPTAPSDPPALAELASKRLRISANFTTPTDPANPVAHLCNVYYATDLPVRQDKTLELRTHLVSVNLANNLFSCLVTMDAKGGEYVLMWSRTEVALLKWSQTDGFSVAFWETHSGAYIDVILALALTPEGDDLLIEAKVSRRVNGATVYQRTVRDTPGSDWGVPDPLPHGWQIFGPDPGPAYTGDVKIVGLGMVHDTDGQQGTAVVQFDNLEYRAFVPPKATCVIDDFEQDRKLQMVAEVAHADWEIADGQFSGRLPTAQSYAALCYSRGYELAEGEPVTISVDVVNANRSDVRVLFGVTFSGRFPPQGGDRGYGLDVRHNGVQFFKMWDGTSIRYFDQGVPSDNAPKTLSLTFTRQGPDLMVDGKVVQRDDPQTVLFSMSVTDTPAVDGAGDNGPPPSGPTKVVIIGFYSFEPTPGAAVVLDNVVCSHDPAPPRLGIRRTGATEATLAWAGGNIALESDSVLGPWRPCPEPMALGECEYSSTVPLSGVGRYYRLVGGRHYVDSFDTNKGWQTTSVVSGAMQRPIWSPQVLQSRGRIYGTGANNEDFMLRFNDSRWFTDCVATVDIIDWGEAMEDATFGIVLRAQPKPEHDEWFSNTAGLPAERYAGLLTFKKGDNPAESALSITGQDGAVLDECRFPAVNPEKQYRLRFWAVGDQLKLELFSHDDLDTPIVTCTKSHGGIPDGMFALYGTKSAGGTYEVVIDQFMLSGAWVY